MSLTVQRKWLASRTGTIAALMLIAALTVGCLCPCLPISCDAWLYADAWVDGDCDGHH